MTTNAAPRKGSAVLRVAVRALVGLVILAVAFAFFGYMASNRTQAARTPDTNAAPIVRTMTATTVSTTRRYDGFGTARAKRAADITAQIDALVVRRARGIDPGVTVEGPRVRADTTPVPGTPIAYLDARDFQDAATAAERRLDALQAQLDGIVVERESLQDQLDLAEEAVRLAELDLERLRQAIGDDIENPAEIERRLQQLTVTKRDAARIREQLRLLPSRQAALEAQRAEQAAALRTAQLNVERAVITAPFPGVLQSVDIEAGERLSRGQTVARIVDLSTIEVPVRLPASASLDLTPGAPVLIFDERAGRGARARTGTIARIAPEIDPATRTLVAFVELTQPQSPTPDNILPGTFVRVQAQGVSQQQRLVIPRSSIEDDRVWVVTPDSTVEQRAARPLFPIDASFDDIAPGELDWLALDPTFRGTASLKPVEPGDRVVLSPSQDLRLGRTVRTESDTPPSIDELATETDADAIDDPDADTQRAAQ